MLRSRTVWSEHHGKDNFRSEYPDCSAFAFLKQTADKYPDYTAVEFQNKKITFSSMIFQIEQISAALLKIGVSKGDYVSVAAPNTPQTLFMVYAINRIGAVANMIHPLLSAAEIKKFTQNVNSKVLLTFDMVYPKISEIDWDSPCNPTIIIAHISDALPALLKPVYKAKSEKKLKYNPRHKIIDWSAFLKNGKFDKKLLPEDNGTGEDEALILYSGGTTGIPKGVIIQNKAFNSIAVQSTEIRPYDDDVTAGKKVLAIMPAFHGFGLAMCMHVMITMGCHIVIVPKFDYKACTKLIFKKKINYIYAVPALFEAMSRSVEIEKNDLSFIEMIAFSGDKCDKKLYDRMNHYLEKGGSAARMTEAYGLTESLSAVAISPFFNHKQGSTGLPLPGNEVKICKLGTQETAALGDDGEICSTGPTLMKGYYNNPEETAHALQTHADGKVWLHTGDIGCMDEDGYIYYRQRHSRMIIVSGYNVYPTQIEDVINKCRGVNISCVVGVRNKITGQRVVAVVQPNNFNSDLEAIRKEIVQACEGNVAEFARPHEIVFKEEMPRTAMGKVNFRQLVDELESRKD